MQFSISTLSLFLLPLVSALPTELNTRQSLPTTENGLTSSTACKAVTVIFARGTNEAGNVGEIAGPPWFSRLRASLGTAATTVQGVTYTANVAGYTAGGSATGSKEMLRLINLAATQCPSTKIVLGGYRYVKSCCQINANTYWQYRSQGAQLVHNAAASLTSAVTAKIAAGTFLKCCSASMKQILISRNSCCVRWPIQQPCRWYSSKL